MPNGRSVSARVSLDYPSGHPLSEFRPGESGQVEAARVRGPQIENRGLVKYPIGAWTMGR